MLLLISLVGMGAGPVEVPEPVEPGGGGGGFRMFDDDRRKRRIKKSNDEFMLIVKLFSRCELEDIS